MKMRELMRSQGETSSNPELARSNAGRPSHQRTAGNQAVQAMLRDSGQAATLWIEAKPIAIEDGPRSGPRDWNLGIVDLGDKIYVYRVPSPSYKTENAESWSIETHALSKKAGDAIDGTEIRITVGYQQRNSGKLPKVWYEKVETTGG